MNPIPISMIMFRDIIKMKLIPTTILIIFQDIIKNGGFIKMKPVSTMILMMFRDMIKNEPYT
jgi:hypothetical protein